MKKPATLPIPGLFDDMEADAVKHGQKMDIGFPITQPREIFDGPRRVVVSDLDPLTFPFKGEMRAHQITALKESDLKDGHCYFVDPGGGKTFICITEASELYRRDLIDGVMIFAPDGPHEQWIDQQFPLWCAVEWRGIHNRAGKRDTRAFLERRRDGMGVVSVNYDALNTRDGAALLTGFASMYPRYMLIVDESQKIKASDAIRTAETMRWALRARYRRILSGTPLLKGLEDLWSQYEVCKPGLGWPMEPIKLAPKGKIHMYGYMGFKSHYCVVVQVSKTNARAKMIVAYRNEDHLRERVAPFVTRIHAHEFAVMEKPDIIEVSTPMTTRQQAQYRLMKEAMIAEIDGGMITAQNALVQLGKLLQIASGFLYREPEDANSRDAGWEQLGDNKLTATMDLLDQLDEPVLVWTPFRQQQQQLLIELNDRRERKLKTDRPFFQYEGSATVAAWQATKNGVMFGNQGSGMGVGLNLQHAAANIYMANNFSAEARWQSLARTDRMGQTRQVRVWDLISPNTVESRVMAALARKEEISSRNIDGLREFLE